MAAHMGRRQFVRFRRLVSWMGGYAQTADIIERLTGVPVSAPEVRRAYLFGTLSKKMVEVVQPTSKYAPRIRVAIECDTRQEQELLADLLRSEHGRRMKAAELIAILAKERD